MHKQKHSELWYAVQATSHCQKIVVYLITCFSPDALLHLKHIFKQHVIFSMEFYSNSPKPIYSSNILKDMIILLSWKIVHSYLSPPWIFSPFLALQPESSQAFTSSGTKQSKRGKETSQCLKIEKVHRCFHVVESTWLGTKWVHSPSLYTVSKGALQVKGGRVLEHESLYHHAEIHWGLAECSSSHLAAAC